MEGVGEAGQRRKGMNADVIKGRLPYKIWGSIYICISNKHEEYFTTSMFKILQRTYRIIIYPVFLFSKSGNSRLTNELCLPKTVGFSRMWNFLC